MNSRKKILLAEIKALLRGPVPERIIFFFVEGTSTLFERVDRLSTVREIDREQVRAILDEDPKCGVYFFYLPYLDPPESVADEFEQYQWARANQIEPEIPGWLRARLVLPRGQVIEISDVETGKEFIRLVTRAAAKEMLN